MIDIVILESNLSKMLYVLKANAEANLSSNSRNIAAVSVM